MLFISLEASKLKLATRNIILRNDENIKKMIGTRLHNDKKKNVFEKMTTFFSTSFSTNFWYFVVAFFLHLHHYFLHFLPEFFFQFLQFLMSQLSLDFM